MSRMGPDIERGSIWPEFGHNWSRRHAALFLVASLCFLSTCLSPENCAETMGKDLWKSNGRKKCSLVQKAGLLAINFGHTIASSSRDKDNTPAQGEALIAAMERYHLRPNAGVEGFVSPMGENGC
ncbi:hypothetical protein B0H17DRAFT_1155327 [Mycena rosella]|uniref:Uncharacterized protein n=1 Tax=Mycena rosella TaxID=1033263 RepID=A0AAD7AWZ9_MYCRO|nr:hypothetical protein B0H17DRAFT_1155327 [Mycena rosella]